MTTEEWEYAEQNHDLVMGFLRCNYLLMDDFYDGVIFGYLSAVQQYFRDPPSGVTFQSMAFRAMKDSIRREREYSTRAKRSGFTVGFDEVGGMLAGNHNSIPPLYTFQCGKSVVYSMKITQWSR